MIITYQNVRNITNIFFTLLLSVMQPSSIFPSVRCGLEMAILNAIADSKGSNLLDILHPSTNENNKYERSSEIQICALVDSNQSPAEVAKVAAALVKEGFSAIKLKVS